MNLILASSSPHRLALLKSINMIPDKIISPDIDETPLKKEKPDHLVVRLAETKALAVASKLSDDGLIIGADTIVGTKTKVFDKTISNEEVLNSIKFFSGKKIYIKTAVAVIKIEKGLITKKTYRLVISKIKYKRFSEEDIKLYIDSGIGIGVAGGVNIQGFGETLIQNITGSYSGIIGLPLYETINLLKGLGYDPFKSKS